MSNILAFDTSCDACSVALNLDGKTLARFEVVPRQHSERILPMIEQVLCDAGMTLSQLDAIAFGCGPGAFTGVRIATGVVQGLAFAADKPVVQISTLAALAQQAFRRYGSVDVLASIDARMDEIYWANYRLDNNLMSLVGEEVVCAPELVCAPEEEGARFGIGSGWKYQQLIPHSVNQSDVDAYPQAEDIAVLAARDFSLGLAVNAEQAMPVYLRNKVAKKRDEQKP